MAIRVQTQDGATADANAYASVAAFRTYYGDRGVSLGTYTDDQIANALVQSTDFLDARYSFIGGRLKALQGTQCPRYLPCGDRANQYPQDVNTLEPAYLLTSAQWNAVVKACIQMGYRALTTTRGLMPDPTFDKTGQKVAKKTVKAGPVETSTEYVSSASVDANVPSYPMVDLLVRQEGLLRSRSGGNLSRA